MTNQTNLVEAKPELAGWLAPARGRDGALRRPRRRAQRQATASNDASRASWPAFRPEPKHFGRRIELLAQRTYAAPLRMTNFIANLNRVAPANSRSFGLAGGLNDLRT